MTFSGTHTGPLRDLAPSGRQVLVKQTHWFRLANGKMAETGSVRDDVGMMQQIKGVSSGRAKQPQAQGSRKDLLFTEMVRRAGSSRRR